MIALVEISARLVIEENKEKPCNAWSFLGMRHKMEGAKYSGRRAERASPLWFLDRSALLVYVKARPSIGDAGRQRSDAMRPIVLIMWILGN